MRDKALVLERYAAQANNLEAERKAVEIRLRAERKCGQLLKDTEKAPNHHRVSGSTARPLTTLKDMGLSKNQSSKFRQLADIPDEEFEEYLKTSTPPGPLAFHIVQ